MTNATTKTDLQPVEQMDSVHIVFELIHGGHHHSERRTSLSEELQGRTISVENFSDWQEIMKVCESNKFKPDYIIAKINEMVNLINSDEIPIPILRKICQTPQFPSRIQLAACQKSKGK